MYSLLKDPRHGKGNSDLGVRLPRDVGIARAAGSRDGREEGPGGSEDSTEDDDEHFEANGPVRVFHGEPRRAGDGGRRRGCGGRRRAGEAFRRADQDVHRRRHRAGAEPAVQSQRENHHLQRPVPGGHGQDISHRPERELRPGPESENLRGIRRVFGVADRKDRGTDTHVQINNYFAGVTYFPWETGPYLRAGAGLSSFVATTGSQTESSGGLGFLLGAGYALRVVGGHHLSIAYTQTWQSYGGSSATKPDSSQFGAFYLGYMYRS